MKKINLIISSLLISSSLMSADLYNKAENYKNKVVNDIKNSEKPYSFLVSFGFMDDSSNSADTSGFNRNSDPIFFTTVGLKLLPNTLDLTMSYSLNVTGSSLMETSAGTPNRGNYDSDKAEYINIFLKPFKTKYGSVGFMYEYISDIMTLTNCAQVNVNVVNMKNDGKGAGGAFIALDSNDRLGFNRKQTNIKMIYTLPNSSFMPNDFGFEIGTEKGTKFHQGTTFDVAAAGADYDGIRFGVGIYRTDNELKKGFSFKQLQIIMIDYTVDYYDYQANQNRSYDGNYRGIRFEPIYKTDYKGYDFLISFMGEVLNEDYGTGATGGQRVFGGWKATLIF